jgi:hypothetical protein
MSLADRSAAGDARSSDFESEPHAFARTERFDAPAIGQCCDDEHAAARCDAAGCADVQRRVTKIVREIIATLRQLVDVSHQVRSRRPYEGRRGAAVEHCAHDESFLPPESEDDRRPRVEERVGRELAHRQQEIVAGRPRQTPLIASEADGEPEVADCRRVMRHG